MILDVLRQFMANFPLVYHSIVLLLSLVIISKGSGLMVDGVSEYSRKLGLSDYLIGLFVVSMVSSIPELMSGFSGILFNSSDVIFGTLFGSNIGGITLLAGIMAIIGKDIKLKEKTFHKTKWDIILLIVLPFVLLIDGVLDFTDGIILLSAFAIYLYVIWQREGEMGMAKKEVKFIHIYKDGLVFLLSFVAVTIASILMVQTSLEMSKIFNIPGLLVAIIVLGLASQLPDLALGISSFIRGHGFVAVGNMIGSMIVKSLLFFGVFALFKPLTFDTHNAGFMFLLSAVPLLLIFKYIKEERFTRKEGIILVVLYILFIAGQMILFR